MCSEKLLEYSTIEVYRHVVYNGGIMSLEQEIKKSARNIFTDSYEMSIGELASLYRDEEIEINPEFQRLFRWKNVQKTRLIESILLGIPIPPLFVFTNSDGVWELIDGLQRTSTIFEFMGILRAPDGGIYPPSQLDRTELIPSLKNVTWEGVNGLDKSLQLTVRRARIRVEILKKESDPRSKFELFQRLNSGGIELEPQEIRNASMLMIDKPFFYWLKSLSEDLNFVQTISQTDPAEKMQKPMELALRLISYKFSPYDGKSDAREYIDNAMINLIEGGINRSEIAKDFKDTFALLARYLGTNSFRKYNNSRFTGGFSLAAFETIAYGIFNNIDKIRLNAAYDPSDTIKSMWDNAVFRKHSGSGVRATSRLSKLLPLGRGLFDV